MKEEIIEKIKVWDGKHHESLKEAYDQFAFEDSLIPILVQIAQKQPQLQVQLTWIVKHHLENG